MKKFKNYAFLLSSLLVLAGCDSLIGSKAKSSGSGSFSTEETSSSKEQAGEWPAELCEMMNQYLGETIPFVQLDDATLDYYVHEDFGFPLVCIKDYSATSLIDGYADILTEAGYQYDEEYEEYCNDKVALWFLFVNEDGDTRNCIYAYSLDESGEDSSEVTSSKDESSDETSESSSKSSKASSSVNTGTEWPTEIANKIVSYCGELIPYFTGFDVDTLDCWEDTDEYGSYLGIADDSSVNTIESSYGAILENAGYEFYSDDDDCWLYYKGDIAVEYYFYNEDGVTGNVILCWDEGDQTYESSSSSKQSSSQTGSSSRSSSSSKSTTTSVDVSGADFNFTNDNQVEGSASGSKVEFVSGTNKVTIEQVTKATESTVCPQVGKDGTHTRVYWGSKITMEWEEKPTSIEITTLTNKDIKLESSSVTGGTITKNSDSSFTINVAETAENVIVDLTSFTKGHIKLAAIDYVY